MDDSLCLYVKKDEENYIIGMEQRHQFFSLNANCTSLDIFLS